MNLYELAMKFVQDIKASKITDAWNDFKQIGEIVVGQSATQERVRMASPIMAVRVQAMEKFIEDNKSQLESDQIDPNLKKQLLQALLTEAMTLLHAYLGFYF